MESQYQKLLSPFTLEVPGSQKSGEGITIDLCAEISRELSAVLDESELISAKYHLEVGSPGVERALYQPSDYERFAGQDVKVKLEEALELEGFIGQRTIRGTLLGLSESANPLLNTDHGSIELSFDNILSARLVFNWGSGKGRPQHGSKSGSKPRKRSNQHGSRR